MRSRSGGGGPSRGSGSRRARRSVACERGRAGLRQLRFECESRAIGRDLDLDLLRALRLSCSHLPTHPTSQSHLRPIRRLPSRKNLDQIWNGSSLGIPCNFRRASNAALPVDRPQRVLRPGSQRHPSILRLLLTLAPSSSLHPSHLGLLQGSPTHRCAGPARSSSSCTFFCSRQDAQLLESSKPLDKLSRHAHPSLDGLNTRSL